MMNIQDVQKTAIKFGVTDVSNKSCQELIREIQVREGHQPCFSTRWCSPEQKKTCCWNEICEADDYYKG